MYLDVFERADMVLVHHGALACALAHLTEGHEELLHGLVRVRSLMNVLGSLVVEFAQRAEVRM